MTERTAAGRDRSDIQQTWIRHQRLLNRINRIKADYISRDSARSADGSEARYQPGHVSLATELSPKYRSHTTIQDREEWQNNKTQIEMLEELTIQNTRIQQMLLQYLTKGRHSPPLLPPPLTPPWRSATNEKAFKYPTTFTLPPIKKSALVSSDQYTSIPYRSRLNQIIGTGKRRRIRKVVYAIIFISILRSLKSSRARTRYGAAGLEVNESQMFGLRLRDVLTAIHSIYRDPNKRIMYILNQLKESETLDLTEILSKTKSEKERNKIYDDIALIMENIIFEVTEIMPDTGILGTHRKSGVFKMLQSLQYYPPGYFYQFETAVLEDSGRMGVISDDDKIVVLSGMFLGRALVGNFLLRPLQYKLMGKNPELTEKNLKMLSTLFVYLLRLVYRQDGAESPAPVPQELQSGVYTDLQMAESFKRLEKAFKYCEDLMRSWCKEYIKRLNNALLD